MENQKRVLWSGILYTLGRTMAYSILGTILIYIIRTGADTFDLQQTISEWGELIIGPALIVIGVLMLLGEFVDLGGKFGFQGSTWAEKLSGSWGAFILGILFAMAFCPSSGLFNFGMLIPMSATASAGYLLPVVFSITTAFACAHRGLDSCHQHQVTRFVHGQSCHLPEVVQPTCGSPLRCCRHLLLLHILYRIKHDTDIC